MDAKAFRCQKLGCDELNNSYWYCNGTKLYKEDASEEKKPCVTNSLKKKRGRPPKRSRLDGKKSDYEDFDSRKNELKTNKKPRWSVVCKKKEDWLQFANKFKNSKSKTEKNLFRKIKEKLPNFRKIYNEKTPEFEFPLPELQVLVKRLSLRDIESLTSLYSSKNVADMITKVPLSDVINKVLARTIQELKEVLKDYIIKKLEDQISRRLEKWWNEKKLLADNKQSTTPIHVAAAGAVKHKEKTDSPDVEFICEVDRSVIKTDIFCMSDRVCKKKILTMADPSAVYNLPAKKIKQELIEDYQSTVEESHIPYRDFKLPHLLSNSVGSNTNSHICEHQPRKEFP